MLNEKKSTKRKKVDFVKICSMSFGKDSLAMAEKMIELKYPVDEYIFYDTGMEFEAIYNNLREFEKRHNVKVAVVKSEESFMYKMLDREVHKRNGTIQSGYQWCGGMTRWGTADKTRYIKKYLKEKYPDSVLIEYVGIASDEQDRLIKSRQKKTDTVKIYPLCELGMTEKICLDYCYELGYNWNEGEMDLYSVLDRVSCWCCSNKNLKELRNIYKYMPNYWQKLKDLQSKIDRPFRNNKDSIFDLEERFKREIEKEQNNKA